MFIFLSKFIPQFIFPVGLVFVALIAALIFHRKPKLIKALVIFAILVLWVGGNNWVSKSLIKSLEWQYLPPADLPKVDAIVVLGGGTDTAQYPRPIVEINGAGDRMIYAGWLYHQGVSEKILLTGGYIPWMYTQTASPAEDMASLLEMLGVPADALWIESRSHNTYENAVYSAEILARAGIDRIGLVTSALHMPRSVAIFEHQGLEVIPMPTDYSITEERWSHLWEPSFTSQIFNIFPTSEYLGDTTAALREYLGILVYRLKGWL